MKICTLFKFNTNGDPPEMSFSIVDDDHEFGWENEQTLHYEGSIIVKQAPEETP